MPNTIKISKSKNLIFKKLSFLYLVFILFLFLSSPGQFVEHYDNLLPAQEELNSSLKSQLVAFDAETDKQKDLKKLSLETLKELEDIDEVYLNYSESNRVSGEKLKESHFANKEILEGSAGQMLPGLLESFVSEFRALSGRDLSVDLLKPRDFSNQSHSSLEFFFKDTPNGVLRSVLHHLQTVILINSLQSLEGKEVSLNNPEVLPIGQLDLIQNFKKRLAPGEKLLFKVKLASDDDELNVWINGEVLDYSHRDSVYTYYEFLPNETGIYNVDLLYQDQHYYHNFEVNKPGFRFEQDRSTFVAQVGEKQRITLNPSYLPYEDVRFRSEHAELKYQNGELAITPFHPGAFNIYMLHENEILDSIKLFAKDVSVVDVALMDIGGKENPADKAIRLEALNPFWQVVNFRLKITYPNGKQEILRNATRFLRPIIKEKIVDAPTGSLMAFEGIKVIGKNGETYRDGRTVITRK